MHDAAKTFQNMTGNNLEDASDTFGESGSCSKILEVFIYLEQYSSMEPTLDLILDAAKLPARTESLIKVNTEHGPLRKSAPIAICGCRVCLSEVFSPSI